MSSLFSNGATILIAVLLVLAIAYRFYSAFLAAKVLALDPNRITPAHTLKDGQNFHPTNKWVLFGHHFAAISGAGPLIGPVLAAQFGYLPGLLWILIGVCLAGAVQDFVVLTLSMRRNGRSLAQIAYQEIGTASGAAATIGILFVLVIALAGLGKVVTKALGGDTVTYETGTQFIAADGKPIYNRGSSGTVFNYRIPAGTLVIYPGGARKETTSQIMLTAEAPRDPVDIENGTIEPGRRLLVPFGVVVRSDADETVYGAGTEIFAPEGKLITLRQEQNVFHYTLPVGTRIVLRDRGNKPIITASVLEITARVMDLGPTRTPTRPQVNIPTGVLATRDVPEKVTYPAYTNFIAPNTRQPIVALPMVDNAYHYTIPQGTKIVAPDQSQTTTTAPFELWVRPADITVTLAHGYRLVVPAGITTTETVPGSSWGTFTLALTIPIAFLVGIYLYRIRKNRVLEASIIGGLLTVGAVYLGGRMMADDSFLTNYRDWFNLTEHQIGYSMVIYGFVASILPVWLLLCPRDYLSSFLKIGTVILLILGVIIAHPQLHAPALNGTFIGGGPVVQGAVFPFLFITIMCGAISGFHALVASGTTPKMINNEKDARTIGYGAMLVEGLVGIVALIAATAMPIAQYYDINTPPEKIPLYQSKIDEMRRQDPAAATLDEPLPDVGEHVQGRTGGAVTLAMGMAHILNTAVTNVMGNPAKPPDWFAGMFSYWYHFAIMFEALFILTTIDTGTRVGRFLLQETMGKWISPALGKTDSWFSAILATALISLGWWYFLDSNAFAAIWAMFGVANQMLAVMALAIATAALARHGKRRYIWVTLAPMCFVAVTTTSAGVLKLLDYAAAMRTGPVFNPVISALCVVAILVCTGIVVIGALMIIVKPPAAELETADNRGT